MPVFRMAAYFSEETNEEVIELLGNTENIRQLIATLTKTLAGMPSPRFVKTHLPLSLLSPKLLDAVKVMDVARDPRDVIVSSFHHAKLFKVLQFKGSFKDLWNAFLKDLCKTGGWRDYFDKDIQRETHQWIAGNLRDTDLRFPSIEM